MIGFRGTSLGFKGISDLCGGQKPEDSYVEKLEIAVQEATVL